MHILITAGGTDEKIDDVRKITNQATGRLGKVIAERLQHEKITIHYVYGPNAVLPNPPSKGTLLFYPIQSVNDLYHRMEQLLTTEKIDYVIHSMAVSDYYVKNSIASEQLAHMIATQIDHDATESMEQQINTILKTNHFYPEQTDKKLSSDTEQLFIRLNKAPKVIQSIKKWQPATTLIGFKLLVGVSEEHLTQVALQSIQKNQADLILANDLEKINDTEHHAILVDPTGIIERFETRQDIASGLQSLIHANLA